jgi:hypothetical protein
MMNSGYTSHVLEGRLKEKLLQEQVNTLRTEKRLKEVEDALEKEKARGRKDREKANTRGRMWLYMFLLIISHCFAVFYGRAMEAGKKI